jgi:hypothetical protein
VDNAVGKHCSIHIKKRQSSNRFPLIDKPQKNPHTTGSVVDNLWTPYFVWVGLTVKRAESYYLSWQAIKPPATFSISGAG